MAVRKRRGPHTQDPQRFAEDCTAHPVLAGCKVYQDIQAGATAESRQRLSSNLSDPRVAAIVSLDLGLSRGFTDKSLADLHRPVLVIAAGWPSEELPARLESADLARRLPQASVRYLEISDATHFSFMAPCKPDAVQLIEQNDPGDGIICRDGDGGRPRALIQQQVLGVISEFLAQSL